MVHLHVNHDQDKQFLYDSPSTCRIDSLIRNVTRIYNLQSKIQSLVLAVEERVLANRQDYQSDATLALRRALSEAKAYISKDQALHKKQLSPYVLKDHVQNIEKQFVAYQSIASKDSDLPQLTSGTDLLHEDMAQLWWAGKELQRDKQLCDYIGKNEKTKILVNLQSPGLVSTQYSASRWKMNSWSRRENVDLAGWGHPVKEILAGEQLQWELVCGNSLWELLQK